VARRLESLRPARLAILGNHDYSRNFFLEAVADRLTGRLTDLGITVLRNDIYKVAGLQIASIDDLWGSNFQAVHQSRAGPPDAESLPRPAGDHRVHPHAGGRDAGVNDEWGTTAMKPHLSLAGLAWTNVGLHVLALVLSVVGLRPGTPLMPLAERLDYLAQAPLGWTAGWMAWMGCTVALVAFLAAVTWRLGEGAFLARLGLTVAVAGAMLDLLSDAVFVLVFPALASGRPASESLFLVIERVTGIASLVIANGAYSVAILLQSLALRGRPGLAPFTVEVGYAVTGFGLLMAAAGFTGVPWHAEWATGPTIGAFCVWVVLVTHSFDSCS
jgi:hypothetical protein